MKSTLDLLLALQMAGSDANISIIDEVVDNPDEGEFEVPFTKKGILNSVYVEADGVFDVEVKSAEGFTEYASQANDEKCYDVIDAVFKSESDTLFVSISSDNIKKVRIRGLKL